MRSDERAVRSNGGEPAEGAASGSPGTVVTLVFVDLVNSTAIKVALPGTDITDRNRAYSQTILTPHRRRIEADLESFGGRVVKTAGDSHFLVFPNAAEAARWAVAVQMSHAADPIATPLGALQLRVGMHTGAPLSDPNDPGDYIGQEVDYAARIALLAGGSEILLSETTAALERDARVAGPALHSHGERALKGIGGVPVFELLHGDRHPRPVGQAGSLPGDGESQAVSLPQTAREQMPTSALVEALAQGRIVGREAELGELERRLETALSGTGATVMLEGELGIGKSRLAREAGDYARRRGFRVLVGRCEEEGAAPYQPFVEAVREYLHGAESWEVEQTMPLPVACELVRIVPRVVSKVSEIPRVALPPEAARQALLEAVREFFSLLTLHHSPVLLVLELAPFRTHGRMVCRPVQRRRGELVHVRSGRVPGARSAPGGCVLLFGHGHSLRLRAGVGEVCVAGGRPKAGGGMRTDRIRELLNDRHALDAIARAVVSGERGLGELEDAIADEVALIMSNCLAAAGAPGCERVAHVPWDAPDQRLRAEQRFGRELLDVLITRTAKHLAHRALLAFSDGTA